MFFFEDTEMFQHPSVKSPRHSGPHHNPIETDLWGGGPESTRVKCSPGYCDTQWEWEENHLTMVTNKPSRFSSHQQHREGLWNQVTSSTLRVSDSVGLGYILSISLSIRFQCCRWCSMDHALRTSAVIWILAHSACPKVFSLLDNFQKHYCCWCWRFGEGA